MRKGHIIMLAGLLIIGISFFFRPGNEMTAEKLVYHCKEAMGGVSRIDAIRTIRLEVIYPDHDYPIYAEIKRPDLLRSIGGESIMLFDGRKCGMLRDFDRTGQKLDPYLFPEDDWNHAEIDIAWYFPAFFDHPSEYLGADTLETGIQHRIQVDLPLGARALYFVDGESFLPVKMEATMLVKGEPYTSERTFSSFRDENGIIYPRTFTYPDRKGGQIAGEIRRVEFNVLFDDNLFVFPADL